MIDNQQAEELLEQVRVLNARLHRLNSVPRLLALAVLQGIGYALGATIIAGIVLAWMAYFLATLEYAPIINQLFDVTQLQSGLESLQQ